MACLVRPSAALQPRASHFATQQFAGVHPSGGHGAGRWAAPLFGGGGGLAAGGERLGSRLQFAPATPALVPCATSSSSSGGDAGGSEAPLPRKRAGSKPSPVPDVDAEQLLHNLGLDGTADPAALLRNLRKLPGVRQQGVLDNAAAVTAHLCSPAVGLTQQQSGQLLERCPKLFSWPPEQRAAALFGELLGSGLTAAAAAQCFATFVDAANCNTLAPGPAELAAILAHCEDPDSRLGGAVPKVPAAQRTVAALLSSNPSAVHLVCQRAGYLQQRAAELQQAGFTAAQVAELAWRQPDLLARDAAAKVADVAAMLQQELGLPPAQVVSLVARRRPRWLVSSTGMLRERAAALAKEFGRSAAAATLLRQCEVLSCDPAVWRRNLCCMAACGVADPKAALRQCPLLLHVDHAAAEFLQRRLMLQRVAKLSAAQLYEQQPDWLIRRKVPDLAQRLQFVEHRGRDVQQLLRAVLKQPQQEFLATVGASQAEWEAWAAANPPAACPLYGWAQQAAAEEAARLAAALPPELAQWERRQPHTRFRRKAVPSS